MLDLSPASRALEALMEGCACVITRDPQGTTDDGFDQATGTYTPPPNDVTTVYSGPALFNLVSSVGREGNRGGGSFQTVGYKVSIPLAAPELRKGDWVECTANSRDPELVGKRFQVEAPHYATLAYVRKAALIAEEEVAE